MTNLDLSYTQYWQEVQAIADYLAIEAIEDNQGRRKAADRDIRDSRLHDAVDSHELVVYHRGNDTVLRHSHNEDAWLDCYGPKDLGDLVIENGMDGARQAQAFFALREDVQDHLSDALLDAESAWDNKNPVT